MMRLFETLDKMNLKDGENGTRTVAISYILTEGKKCREGGLITMGVDEQALYDLLSGKAKAILCVIDQDEFKKEQQ